jgi:hypothetical protein
MVSAFQNEGYFPVVIIIVEMPYIDFSGGHVPYHGTFSGAA